MVVRGGGLAASMSDYLFRTIEAAGNIEVRLHTTVVGAVGADRLEELTLADAATGRTRTVPADALFILIGASPRTDWLPASIRRDAKGFVLTGQDLTTTGPAAGRERLPSPLETSLPGVLAAGDVRHGSVKRVASAVGEGGISIRFVHDYLAHLPDATVPEAQ